RVGPGARLPCRPRGNLVDLSTCLVTQWLYLWVAAVAAAAAAAVVAAPACPTAAPSDERQDNPVPTVTPIAHGDRPDPQGERRLWLVSQIPRGKARAALPWRAYPQ